MIKVEYLLPFKTDNGICNNIKTFKSLLSTNDNFNISDSFITFKRIKINYSIETYDVKDQKCTVFNIQFEYKNLTDKYQDFLQSFRKTLGPHLKDNIQVIWDGISFEWSKELYPKIYSVENLMRILISKFMLTKLGIGWHNSSVPKDVKDSIKIDKFKPSHHILYEVDFIQLSNFLFKKYTIKDVKTLPDFLANIINNKTIDEATKNTILDYIPKNNWDRYFLEQVDMKSTELEKKWSTLYEIRCKIAHNKSSVNVNIVVALS